MFTIVVRAPAKSGALITARWARAQQREVFAVPGSPDDRTATGCLDLLRDGARLLAVGGDLPQAEPQRGVLPADPAPASATPEPTPDSPTTARLLEALRRGATTTEGLAVEVGLPVGVVLATLTRLALAGRIETTGPGIYAARS